MQSLPPRTGARAGGVPAPAAERKVGLVYGRKSYIRGAQAKADLVSVEKQLYHCTEACKERGHTPEIYQDADGHRSGRHEHTRPEWMRVKARLSAPEVAALYVYEFDRASRSVRDSADLIETCQRHGVAIISINDHIDTTRAMGSDEITYILLKAVLSQRESDKASERQRDRVKWTKQKLGYWGSTPFGSKRIGQGSEATMVRNTPHDATVVEIMEMYAAGHSHQSITDQLNQRGFMHLSRKGLPVEFGVEAVRSITQNVLFYSGHIVVDRRFHSKDARIELDPGEGGWLDRYAKAMGAMRSPRVEPLISDELANRVVEQRYARRRTGRSLTQCRAMLTPMLYFGDKVLRAQDRPNGVWVYRTRAPNSKAFAGQVIDDEMLNHLSNVTFPAPLREALRAEMVNMDVDTERQRLATRIAGLTAKLERIRRMNADGYYADYGEFTRDYRVAELELAQARNAFQAPTDIDVLIDALATLGQAIRAIPVPRRKRALGHVFERIEIDGEGRIKAIYAKPWAQQAFKLVLSSFLSLYQSRPRQDSNTELVQPVERDSLFWFAATMLNKQVAAVE